MMPDLPLPNLLPGMIWAATYFIHSSLLLISVWLWFRWREPRSHALREMVWKLAAVGGLLTASLQLGLGIESPLNQVVDAAWRSAHSASQTSASKSSAPQFALRDDEPAFSDTGMQVPIKSAAPEVSDMALLDNADLNNPPAGTQLIGTEVPSPDLHFAAAGKIASVSSRNTPAAWLAPLRSGIKGLFAAVCGAIVALSAWGLVRLLSEQRDFRQRLKSCRIDETGPARRVLDELLASVGVPRPVRLMLDDHDLEPGACGWFQWQIVLPSRAVEVLSREELRGLLAHELAHLVRRDQWWLLVGRLLAVCFGWQPLNRVALREWQRASEYLCDAWAIQRQVPRLSLARCLTTVAEWRLVGLATVAGMGSQNLSNLSQRVERLVDDVPLADPWQRYSRRHLLAAAGCLIAVGMVSLAPAATLPQRPSPVISNPSALANVSSEAISVPSNSQSDIIIGPQPAGAELVTTNVDLAPPSVQITIQTLQVVRQQTSVDLIELNAEINALQKFISQSPHLAQRPLWRAQLRRFQQRIEKLQRLQNQLVAPL